MESLFFFMLEALEFISSTVNIKTQKLNPSSPFSHKFSTLWRGNQEKREWRNIRTPLGTNAFQRHPRTPTTPCSFLMCLKPHDGPQQHQRESSTSVGLAHGLGMKETSFSSGHFSEPFMSPHRGMLLKPLQASSLVFFFFFFVDRSCFSYGQMFSPFSGKTQRSLR